ARGPRPLRKGNNLGRIAAEVPYRGVDLSQGNLHKIKCNGCPRGLASTHLMRLLPAPQRPTGIIGIVETTQTQTASPAKVESFLLEVADAVNTSLDLDTTLNRVAELVRRI